jgi:hypothetical protein
VDFAEFRFPWGKSGVTPFSVPAVMGVPG